MAEDTQPTEETKPCPMCREEIDALATKCKHCGEFIAPRPRLFGWWQASWAEIRGDKTLWDFLSLLIVPIMLFGIGFWFNRAQSDRQDRIELDRGREAALQNYYDEMTELLLQRELGTSESAQDIARARTLAVLRSLDAERRGMLVGFLDEAGLIQGDSTITPVIRLDGADLRGAYLFRVDLSGANLSEANLSRAFLVGADLRWAALGWADLRWADLRLAALNGADLQGAWLIGADLTGADLRTADLGEAKYNDQTRWPDDFDPQAHGAIKQD